MARPPAPLVTLLDAAVPPGLFERLLRAVSGLGERGLRTTWQTTFWFPKGARASCVVEDAIVALVKAQRLPRAIAGFEWWLSRMRTSNVPLDFHRDHDIALAEAGGPVRHPWRSSVLFLNRARGGLLAVTLDPPNPRNLALAPTRHAFDLVAPKPNRLAWFDGRLTHGVLDAEDQIPGRRLPRQPALRLAVAINFWTRKPTGARPFAQAGAYPQLANAHRGRVKRVLP